MGLFNFDTLAAAKCVLSRLRNVLLTRRTAVRPQRPEFPIPENLQPKLLRNLLALEPVESIARQVYVSGRSEKGRNTPSYEYHHMTMALVRDEVVDGFGLPRESQDGTVAHSVPDVRQKGGARDIPISISGEEYAVASWGSGSYFGYHLADRLWMMLGLSPRSVGGDHQSLIYDDLKHPLFSVAKGEISNKYYYTQSRDVRWTIRNDYLRRYLWMTNRIGVRVFYYEAKLPDTPEWRIFFEASSADELAPNGSWFSCRIFENDGLLLQVHAAPIVISNELCNEPSADGLVWPDHPQPMTRDRTQADNEDKIVYLKDEFLSRYEKNSIFDCRPHLYAGGCTYSPQYEGQWSISSCNRLGRNLLKTNLRDLYRDAPDSEIIHAHAHAVSASEAANFDATEQNIAEKANSFLQAMMRLSKVLVRIGVVVSVPLVEDDLCGFSETELHANGWTAYPSLQGLASVAPRSMTEQDFLGRCKALYEMLQKIPNISLRKLLIAMGCTDDLGEFALFRLLQAFFIIGHELDSAGEDESALPRAAVGLDLTIRQDSAAFLFKLNELRILDAHVGSQPAAEILTDLGFDTALLNDGFGEALDFIFDQVTSGINSLNDLLERLYD